jgi:hypothetical protein
MLRKVMTEPRNTIYKYVEPKLGKIEFVHKDVDHPNRIVLPDPVAPCWRTSVRDIKGCSAERSGPAPLDRPNAANSESSTTAMNGQRLFMICQIRCGPF